MTGDTSQRTAWIRVIETRLRTLYGIGIEEAPSDQLDAAWHLGETPDGFVAWFAEKYDLSPVAPVDH